MSKRVRTIANIVSANRHRDEIYAVMTVYPETDALNAGGLILRTSVDRAGSYATLLRTNDALQTIWASPQGSIWAVSARGTVWTTAPVPWSKPRLDWLDHTVEVQDYDWKISPLPPLSHNGAQPVGQLIWGTGDQRLGVDRTFIPATPPGRGGTIVRGNTDAFELLAPACDHVAAVEYVDACPGCAVEVGDYALVSDVPRIDGAAEAGDVDVIPYPAP